MNKVEIEKENIRTQVKNVNMKSVIAYEVSKKELELLFDFENRLEEIEKEYKNKEIEFDKLMEEYQHLANEIDRLANFILNDVEGEPSESEGAVDTAIRLLKGNL